MNAFLGIVRCTLRDLLRSRWLIAYALVLGLVTDLLLRFGGSPERAGLSLVSVVLLAVPVVSLVVGVMVVYAGREFTELLLAQPIPRPAVFLAQYVGIVGPLSLALLLGLAVPFGIHGVMLGPGFATLAALVGAGVALTWIFGAIAQLVAVRCEDRVKGLAIGIAVWLAVTMLYDGLVLAIAATFSDYPLDKPMLALLIANPVDLARLALLFQFDTAALMGYTGAVFRQFFGTGAGLAIALAALALWVGAPLTFGLRAFARKDF